jgi:hypothetical protein
MGAETSGRKLGIGLRLAARAAWDRANQTAASASTSASATKTPSVKTASNAVTQAKSKGKAIAEGTRRFGEAVVGPVAHTSGVLWLEITGLFFLLFAAFFGQSVYKLRGDWKTGPGHTHFLIYSSLTLIFIWFSGFNFFKARQKEKKNRARRAARS